MPPRIVAIIIVAFWLFSSGWLAYREWWPWLQADTPPPFTVELADEAAPLYAQWSIWRVDRKVGSASTRMVYRKDNTFELNSTVEHLEWLEAAGAVKIVVPRLSTVQKVTRDGQLLAMTSNLQIEVTIPGQQKLEMKAGLEGTVTDGKLIAQAWMESPLTGRMEQQLDPLPLESGSAINPLQPVAKLAVYPGQRWKITNVDPLVHAVAAALKQSLIAKYVNVGKLINTEPQVLMAQVLSEPQQLTFGEIAVSCYVVEYRSNDFEGKFQGKTWVRISDSKVLRQEVSGNGEKLTLVRED
jgi:hypothetical protein